MHFLQHSGSNLRLMLLPPRPLGFPVALVLAWAFELTREGVFDSLRGHDGLRRLLAEAARDGRP